MLLFVGDDWAEDHHDLKIEDQDGHRLARARLPEGLVGITRAAPTDRRACSRGLGGTAGRAGSSSGCRRDRD